MELNMPKKAVGEYLQSMFKQKVNVKSYIGASRAYRELQQYDKAIKHLEKAKKSAAFDYGVYYELGLCHMLNSDFYLANQNFRKTIKLNPDFYDSQIQLAISHELMDEPEMAFKIYEKIIEENPFHLVAHNHKAGLLMSLNNFEEAAKVFFHILSIDSDYERAYLGLGICFDKLEKYSNAVRFYKKFIERSPKNPTAKSIASRIIDIVQATGKKEDCRLRIVQ